MSLEYEAMLRGERPVRNEDNFRVKTEQKLVSCYTKEFGTSEQAIINGRHPCILPGLGESGQHCQKCVVYGIGINGDKIGVRNLKCKRIECPNCYKNWVLDRVFETTFKLEAYAKITGDRPAHVVASIAPQICRTWTTLDQYETFHKRVYRHLSAIGVDGGLRIFHPYRINPGVIAELKKVGYGTPGNGYWKGVRENALGYENFEQYYSLGVHDHTIVFPSFLSEHTDRNFVVKKIGVLDTMDDTIKALYYLISHCGVLKDTESADNHPLTFFGELHRFNPEKFLSAAEILELKTEIAKKLHCKIEDGELIPVSDDEKPSNKDEFYPISQFIKADPTAKYYDSRSDAFIDQVLESFPEKYREFWTSLIDEYNRKITDKSLLKDEKNLFMSDITLPDGIHAVEVV